MLTDYLCKKISSSNKKSLYSYKMNYHNVFELINYKLDKYFKLTSISQFAINLT